jgi:plastocyanin
MIIWKNLGSKNHSIIFPKLNISSGIILPEENFSIEFNYSGNFSYGCGLHPKDIGNILVN